MPDSRTRSAGLTPALCTRILTCPAVGFGSAASTSLSASGPPNLSARIAFIERINPLILSKYVRRPCDAESRREYQEASHQQDVAREL